MSTQSLGEIVRQERIGALLTCTELAKLSGLSISYISDIETGKRIPQAIPTINALAKALKLNPVYLAWAAGIVHPKATWVDGPRAVKTSLGEIPKYSD